MFSSFFYTSKFDKAQKQTPQHESKTTDSILHPTDTNTATHGEFEGEGSQEVVVFSENLGKVPCKFVTS